MKRKVTLKFGEVLVVLNGLKEINAPGMNGNFNLDISKNIKKLEEIAIMMEKEKTPSKDYLKVAELRKNINEDFAEKDKAGNPKKYVHQLPGGGGIEKYVIPGIDDPNSEYSIKMTAFDKKHKKVIDERNKQAENFNAMLDEETSVRFRIANDQHIPDGLSRTAMDALTYMLFEEEEEENEEVKDETPLEEQEDHIKENKKE